MRLTGNTQQIYEFNKREFVLNNIRKKTQKKVITIESADIIYMWQ